MPKLRYSLLFLLSIVYGQICFSQEGTSLDSCAAAIKEEGSTATEKSRLVYLIKSTDTYKCRWRDLETGFAKTTDSLIGMTTLDEKKELFRDRSPILRYYLFPAILYENDSLAFELLKKDITDSTGLYSFCSCMTDDTPLNLRLLSFYYSFIRLKYQYGTGGTIEGYSFSFTKNGRNIRSNKKWKQKITALRDLIANNIPAYRLGERGEVSIKKSVN